MNRKGIILAGGSGTRLQPLTIGNCKQLLPIYNKPMVYYPLTTLMLCGIREILLITTPEDKDQFYRLLGDGSLWGISIEYAIQLRPLGIAEAFIIGADFIQNSPVALILGDNFFYGDSFVAKILDPCKKNTGATVIAYSVTDPERYGVIEFDSKGNVKDIVEKPDKPKSNYAMTGLYFYDSSVVEKALNVSPSLRGELEITDINLMYLKENNLNVQCMGRGMTWLDMGTFESLHEAGSYIRTIEKRQFLKVGCPEEVAWRQGWISDKNFIELAQKTSTNSYGNYLKRLVQGI
tara:strand:+ start:645 stop:1520 length:876 start_codon:yes stop_codon:yes gene_type:complete